MTTLVMPRLGETVTEGVIVKWLKKEGEKVKKDQPVVEISTDKVETDIPSPSDGTLVKIKAAEGDKVSVGQPIAELSKPEVPEKPAEPKVVRPVARVVKAEKPTKVVVSPLVRRLAQEKKIDLSQIKGTGAGGRITKEDILKYKTEEKGEMAKPLSVLKKTEAEHLIKSHQESVHVTAIVEADFTKLDKLRKQYKQEFKAKEGFSLTYLPFVSRAAVSVLQKMPLFNAELKDDQLLYKPHINLGIAVALPEGLIVPVIKKAESLSITGLARAINDIAKRARANKLGPDEVHEGTFTITNNGSFGSLIQTPIIVPGQLAILSLESITKRVDVVDDAIAIRKKAFLPLTYDHRVIEGALASTFLVELKNLIEKANFQISPTLGGA